MQTRGALEFSVVVVIVGDTVTRHAGTEELAETLRALANQVSPPSMEILVPYHAGVNGIEKLKLRFPSVTFLPVYKLQLLSGNGGREHHDEMRAWGAAAARGDIVAFLEDHVHPDPHWAVSIMEAHRHPGFAVIGGAIENSVNRPLNWAVYFCDLGKYQNPVPTGESLYASLVNNSYQRAALEAVRPAWGNRFNETVVNRAIRQHGQKIALSPDVVVYQHRRNLRVGTVLREFFIWGRSYARTRSTLVTGGLRMFYLLFSPGLPVLLLLRLGGRVVRRRRCIGAFVCSLPFLLLVAVSWSLGEFAGYLRPSTDQTPSHSRQQLEHF
jgi:hypothetical protein